MKELKIITSLICILLLLSAGCTALNTFPTAARPGETVALAVGSPDNLTIANVNSVIFQPISPPGSTVDLTSNVRSIFKLYADKTSIVYENPGVSASQIVRTSMHEPWLTVMAIDLPEGLAPGIGEIIINTNENVTYPTIGNHINDRTITLEILPEPDPANPSLTTANDFEYEFGKCCSLLGDLSYLEARPHALVKSQYSESPPAVSSYAAIEMKVDFTGTTDLPISDDNVKVVVDDMTVYTNSKRQVITSVNNEVLTVILMSMSDSIKPYEMRFAVALEEPLIFSGPLPAIASIKYYDSNGTEQTGATAYSVDLR